MGSSIEFCKLSGSGNDFICIDNRDGAFDAILSSAERVSHFARMLCRRGLGIGADGVVFAGRPEIDGVGDVAARFLEPDGGEATLCGNGTACFVRWAIEKGIVPDGEVRILTSAGVVLGQHVEDGYVRVCIPLPQDMRTDLRIEVDGQLLTCDYIVTGVEHLVTYVADIDRVDVAHLGQALRNHPDFPQPRGVNASFVQILGEGRIAVRTFEYGVEAETLACGTGSAAAAILATRRFGWPKAYRASDQAVEVRAASGDILRMWLTMTDDDRVTDLCLETVVRCTFSGTVCPDLTDLAMERSADQRQQDGEAGCPGLRAQSPAGKV